MRFSFELDAWDLGALVAVAAVLIGLFAWHWPAGLVAAGAAYLWLYYLRERSHATDSPAEPPAPGPDGAGGD